MVEEWPFKRRDAANTASTAARGPERDPELRWQYDAGSRIYGTPVVRDCVVYVGTQEVVPGTAAVHAVDAETGERRWASAEDGFEIRGTPAVAGGRVYAADFEWRRFTLSAADGEVIDQDELGHAPRDGIDPLVHDGTLYTNRYQVTARDPADWSVRWQTEDGCFVRMPAVVDGTAYCAGFREAEGRVYLGRTDFGVPKSLEAQQGFVRAVDRESGDRNWEATVDGYPRTPAVADGTMYVGTEATYPPETNAGRETLDMPDTLDGIGPAFGPLDIPDGEPRDPEDVGAVHAIDATTGDERWSVRLSHPVRAAPAVRDGVVCLSAGDSVVAYDAATGAHRWTSETGDTTVSSPAIADGVVYVGSRDEHLYAVDLYDGTELWRFETDHSVDSNPSVVDGTVYVGDNGGNVYAVKEA